MLQNEPTLTIVAVDTEENERLTFGVNYSVYSSTSLVAVQILRPSAIPPSSRCPSGAQVHRECH